MISNDTTWSAYTRAATQLRLSMGLDPAPKCDQARAALAGMVFAVHTFCEPAAAAAIIEEGLGLDECTAAELRALFTDLRDPEATPKSTAVVIDLR
jgi:hypothetical protein